MKVLVTGATGFVGANLIKRLTQDGYTVHAFCRSHPDEQIRSNPNVIVFRGDIVDKASINKAMDGCAQVYHLCAFTRSLAKKVEEYYKVNVGGTIIVLECAEKLGVEKVVYTSAGGVFGPSYDKPVNENWFRVCSFFNDHETSKFLAEEKIKDFVSKGLNVVIVNPGRIYGPGYLNKTNAITQIIRSYMKGKWHIIPGNGKTVMSYSYIEDIVNGQIQAMKYGKPGQRYILGGTNASYLEFFNALAEASGKKNYLFKIPFWLLKIYASIEVTYSRIVDKEPDITPRWVKSFQFNMARSSDRAVNELGYKTTPLNEGIRKTVEWLNGSQL